MYKRMQMDESIFWTELLGSYFGLVCSSRCASGLVFIQGKLSHMEVNRILLTWLDKV